MATDSIRGRTITLVGFMGCGKSTVGRLLAMRLKLPFKDVDDLVEEVEGMSISKIFSEKGEQHFREIERKVILSTPDEGERVLAVGGGGFNETTVDFIKRLGPTVHLDLTFQEIQRRIKGHDRRPLAARPDLFSIFIARKRFYSRAHYRVWVEGLTVDEVVEEIMRLV